MRKTTILSAIFIGLMLAGVLPSVNNEVSATHLGASTFVANCTIPQGAGCQNTIIREASTISTLTDWDPEAAYDTGTSAIIGTFYDQPFEFNGNSTLLTGYVPGAAILGATDDGKTFSFHIATGIHFYRIPSSDANDPQKASAGTMLDLGEVKAHDWANATARWVGTCNGNGAAPVDAIFIYGAEDFFNAGCTRAAWDTFMALRPITYDDTASNSSCPCFTIKADGDLNSANGQDPFPALKGLIANTWSAVYSLAFTESSTVNGHPGLGCGVDGNHPGGAIEVEVEAAIGTCNAAEAMLPPFDLGESGPYLLANNETTATSFTLLKNPNYCQGQRTTFTVCGGATTGPEVSTLLHSQRPTRITYKQVPTETDRVNDLLNGRTDTGGIGLPANLATFLTGSTLSSLKPHLNQEFRVYPTDTLTVEHVGMMVHRDHSIAMEPGSSAYFKYPNGTLLGTGVSQLEGPCTSSVTNSTPDSFGCINRRAILSAFNYTEFIQVTLLRLGIPIADFIPIGFTGSEAQAVADGYLTTPTLNQKHANDLFHYNKYDRAHPLHLVCGYNAESEERKAICFQLASDLQALHSKNLDGSGATNTSYIFVTPVAYRSGTWGGKVFNTQSFDMYPWGWFPDYIDMDNYARPYYYGGFGSASAAGTWTPTVGFGVCNLSTKLICSDNSTLDNQINAAATITNPTTRAIAYEKIQRDASQSCRCYIPLDQVKARPIVIASVTGFEHRGLNSGFLYPNRDLVKTLLSAPPGYGVPTFPNFITTVFSLVAIVGAITLLIRTRKTPKILK